MPALLEKITRDLSKKGIEPRSAEAKAFIQKMIGQAKIPTNRSNVLNDPKRTAPFAVVGKMFMFRYDPLTKEKLPQWDEFPLVIPTTVTGDGFTAINFHWLGPGERISILDGLTIFLNNDKYDDSTRFNLSYDLLKNMSRFSSISRCMRRYLYDQMISPMIYIEPNNWETACFLPVQNIRSGG
jgi:hypothetical protein